MSTLTLENFSADMLAQGYAEVLERPWAPGTVVAEHAHPFEADAVVVRGEMWLTVDGQERHLLRGDKFHLMPGKPHSERYGDEGATYWVARR